MKSTDRILAQRYAKAFDALSSDAEQAWTASQGLANAAKALEQAQAYMQIPAISCEEKIAFIEQVFGKQNTVSSFICELLKAKRYYLLSSCALQVQQLADARMGITRAEVQTAFELSPQQQAKVEQALSALTSHKAKAYFTVEPELIGGLCARLGDTLIDGSVKGRFEKLDEELKK